VSHILVRKRIAQNPLLITQLGRVPTLLQLREREVDARLYALLLAFGITFRLERVVAEEADGEGFSKEIATALTDKSGLSALVERTWEYLVQTGYWIPYHLITYALEDGGIEGALERAASYRQRGGLDVLVADALILANAHLLSAFRKKG
jgi:hypothetical protein